jgi:EF-P beta-lysylation protein EpmB
MRRGDLTDPLLRQVWPDPREVIPRQGFTTDPVGDIAAQSSPGLLRKYAGRALMVTTGACAVHCRYCFRRHFPYAGGPRSVEAWTPALDELAADPSITEVILSGGDPLVLGDDLLGALAERMAAIPHLARLRIHSRLPVVLPDRIDDRFLSWFAGTRLRPILVIHANCVEELAPDVDAALRRLATAGVPLLNQTVLLAGINDSVDAQLALCTGLVDRGVFPYYLHELDRVAGAAHFEAPPDTGARIVQALRDRLPGYAVPRLVREEAGRASKTPVA